MTIPETLFDPDLYGPGKVRRQRASEASTLPPVEQLSDGWRLIRSRNGVLPFAHLVKAVNDYASVLTLCNQWGTTMPRFADDAGRRCPLCDMEAQL